MKNQGIYLVYILIAIISSFVSACTLLSTDNFSNQNLTLNYTDCVTITFNGTNLTINSVGFPRLNEVVQFHYPSFGVPGQLEFDWPDANLIVLNAQMPAVNMTLQPGQYNDSLSQTYNVSAYCDNQVMQTFCPQAGNIALGYGTSYANSTYGLNVTAPPTCVNSTSNIIENPCLGIDRRLDAGEVWANASLCIRLECTASSGISVDKELKQGENYYRNNTYYQTLNLTCTNNLFSAPTPAATEPTATLFPTITALAQSPPQPPMDYTQPILILVITAIIFLVFKDKLKQGGGEQPSPTPP
jgi:hypothetical protein